MAAPKKDTIYVDVDDEITAIIEKVQNSTGKVIALVLPKRASVFQSVVNMKLLKRTTENAKKHLVLITSEAGLLPLAGAVGLHVAKTAQSKPSIPEVPVYGDQTVSVDVDGVASDEPEPALDPTAPIGSLAGVQNSAADTSDTIEVDNDDEPAATAPKPVADSPAKPVRNKRLQVPDFNKFRLRLVLAAVVAIALIVGGVFAFLILPKAKITIVTNNVNVASSVTLTGLTAAKTVDQKANTLPAELKEFKKTDSQKVPATGQKDAGTVASGTITVTLTDCPASLTIPQGTAVSSGSLNFITQDSVMLLGSTKAGKCNNDADATSSVKVVAQSAGGQYNLSPRSYAVSGFSNVTASGSAMSGGTSKMVTVVSQSDVDTAKQKILDTNGAAGYQTVAGQLKTDGYSALTETQKASDPLVVATPNVGDEASDVTVNVTVTYSMTGVQTAAIQQFVEADITKKIDTKTQKILSNGLDKATLHVTKTASGSVTFTVQSNALAGVQQDSEDIKKQAAGKKRGDVQTAILARPGIKDVTVQYSPAWVLKTPSSTKKITVVFQQADGATQTQ